MQQLAVRGGGRAALIVGVASLVLSVGASRPAEAADTCPNANVRQQTGATSAGLLDCRAYEMVSPVEKNGGQIDPPGGLYEGGVLQAAAAGGSITYGSAASFGDEAKGAPGASQYISRRSANGWVTENITVPIFSGSFWTATEGVPYRLFSPDLARGLLLSGRHCRGEQTGCPVPNEPLDGTEAPAGYQNYYLRQSAGPSFNALLRSADIAGLGLDPVEFSLSFAGAAPDLRHVVLSTCSALTANATEVAGAEGCDPGARNLYLSSGSGLRLVNILPGDSVSTPAAELGAESGAVSPGGSRIYWKDLSGGNLYLREGSQTKQVDEAAGGGGTFEAAGADGAIAFFTKDGHLYRYSASAGAGSDLTPSGGVAGVLGASEDGTRVYFQDDSGLKLWEAGGITTIAAGGDAADPGSYPPATGTARVSEDGAHLLFVSKARLTGYDNTGLSSGEAESQVFLYSHAGSGTLTCVSCNPAGTRPEGASTLSGAIANGAGPEATRAYKPRALPDGGRRVFFESEDSIVLNDTNNASDVYQWTAQGTGSCTRSGGCIALISSGRAQGGAIFVDASADGTDVFFLTRRSLVDIDPDALDLYNARSGGGFEQPPEPIPCEGDSCQVLPSEPKDPTLTTLLSGRGNPDVSYQRAMRDCGPLARRSRVLRQLAVRSARRLRSTTNPRQRKKLRVQQAKLVKRSRMSARHAFRCRLINVGADG